MAGSERFNISYLRIGEKDQEEPFLSVTPRLRFGPGIQRDGLTAPRMTDPHTVAIVTGNERKPSYPADLSETQNPFVQRAGTWTLFDHAKDFLDAHGETHLLLGIQSVGDLTMNPWHVALFRRDDRAVLARLATPEEGSGMHEPIHQRVYPCLVKWRGSSPPCRYEFIDLFFHDLHDEGIRVEIRDERYIEKNREGWLKTNSVSAADITDFVEFALSGKAIVRKDRVVSLSNVIDAFQDVRHIFNVPTVPAHGAKGMVEVKSINFGEHVLFNDLNARRAALSSPIIVDLRVPDVGVEVVWSELAKVLDSLHFRISEASPTRRGEYRLYSRNAVEIFYPANVYPFGVVGGGQGRLVGLASGGLSGRVGNTLQGITRIMYDFFGCEDALVLDEGFDTCQIINPRIEDKVGSQIPIYRFSNNQMLEKIASFMLWRVAKDEEKCRNDSKEYPLGKEMRSWPLNEGLFSALDRFAEQHRIQAKSPDDLDIVAVAPLRAQIRAVLLFCARRDSVKVAEETG